MTLIVTRIPYMIKGPGLDIVKEQQSLRDIARKAFMDYAMSLGGSGYLLWQSGLCAVGFKDGVSIPTGWKEYNGKYSAPYRMYSPKTSTLAGKEADKAIKALPRYPRDVDIAMKLGYAPANAITDGGKIYFPGFYNFTDCGYEAGLAILDLPRQEGDGFEPDPAIMEEIKMSEFHRQFEIYREFQAAKKEEPADAG